MSAIGDGSTPASSQAGTTLLEMLVVLGVLGLVAGLAFPNLRRTYASLGLEASQSELAADLRTARAQAIRTGQSVAFEVSEEGDEYSAGAQSVRLPKDIHLAADPRSIEFASDGGSEGGQLQLTGATGRALTLRVLPTVGVVELGDGH